MRHVTLAIVLLGTGCLSALPEGTEFATSGSSTSGSATGSTSGSTTSSTSTSSGSSSGAGVPQVATLAGNGTPGWNDGSGGPSGTAEFDHPDGVAVDDAGNVFVADYDNSCIRRIDLQGNVTTFAGNGDAGWADGTGGPGGSAAFDGPDGLAFDSLGNLYVADFSDNRIRKIDPLGNVTTFAGNGTAGFFDGTGGPNGTTELNAPEGVAVDALGNLFVTDDHNFRIRELTPAGNATTLAGDGQDGFFDGSGGPTGTAEFSYANALAVDGAGNVYVADTKNNRIRKIDPLGNVTTFAGNGAPGWVDGAGGPTGPAELNYPLGLAIGSDGTLYVADSNNNRIRAIDASGNVSTVAGNGAVGDSDGSGGPNGTATFNNPVGVAIDAAGTLYVGDARNNKVRVITGL